MPNIYSGIRYRHFRLLAMRAILLLHNMVLPNWRLCTGIRRLWTLLRLR